MFNKNRYFKLLKSNNELSRELKNELLNYKVILETSIIYHNREKYITLLQQHVDECRLNLDDNKYESGFLLSELYYKNLEDYHRLENKVLKEGIKVFDNFLIYSNANEFSDWIDYIIRYTDEIDDDIIDYADSMEFALLQLRDVTNSVSTNLINRSYYSLFLILATIVLIYFIPTF